MMLFFFGDDNDDNDDDDDNDDNDDDDAAVVVVVVVAAAESRMKWLSFCRRMFSIPFREQNDKILIEITMKLMPGGLLTIRQHWFKS